MHEYRVMPYMGALKTKTAFQEPKDLVEIPKFLVQRDYAGQLFLHFSRD
jgi:hypothetical protein